MTPRRFPPLYPGDVRRCPNGCPLQAPGHEDWPPPTMPDYAPECGYWLTCCLFCGWVGRYILRHGDRVGDVYWITDEEVSPAQVADVHARALSLRREVGLGPWPVGDGD